MKKTLLLLALMTGYYYLPAQEMIVGGNMEDESAWTIIDVGAAYDASTVTFNYSDDKPSKGMGGCLSISAAGITRNFIYQKVKLAKGHKYALSCALKNASDTAITSYWVEVNLVNREPVLVGEGTGSDFVAGKSEYQMGMHYWKTVNGIDYNRIPNGYDDLMENTINFAWLGAANGVDSVITDPRNPNFNGENGNKIKFTLPDTVSTTDWYVLFKVGAFTTAGATEPVYNWLFDELSLWDLAEPLAIKNTNTESKLFDIYPNPVTDGAIRIKTNTSSITTYNVYNTLGMLIKSGTIESNSTLNVSGLNKGMYVLSLSNGTLSEQYKVLVK